MTDDRTGEEAKKDSETPWRALLVLVFIWLVLASPMPPFDIIPKIQLSILIPQILALCVLAIGVVIGSLLSRPLIQFFQSSAYSFASGNCLSLIGNTLRRKNGALSPIKE
jgi:hypothetical protein